MPHIGKEIVISGRDLERFKLWVARVTVSPTGCWLWPGKPHHGLYGTFRIGDGSYRAHRVSYEVHVGPVPPDLMVCHKCDTPLCINPEHLFLGTCLDNIRDCLSKGRGPLRVYNKPISGHRAPKGEAHRCAKLTEADVAAIRATDKSVASTYLATVYGVSRSTISHARSGLTWGHVPLTPAAAQSESDLLTINEVAARLGTTPSQVAQLSRNGRLKGRVTLDCCELSRYRWPAAAIDELTAQVAAVNRVTHGDAGLEGALIFIERGLCPEDLISAKEVGRVLSLTESQTHNALKRLAGKVRIGKSVWWPRAAFEEFVASGRMPKRRKVGKRSKKYRAATETDDKD